MEEVEETPIEETLKVGDRIIYKSFSIKRVGVITSVGERSVFIGDIMVLPFEVVKKLSVCTLL